MKHFENGGGTADPHSFDGRYEFEQQQRPIPIAGYAIKAGAAAFIFFWCYVFVYVGGFIVLYAAFSTGALDGRKMLRAAARNMPMAVMSADMVDMRIAMWGPMQTIGMAFVSNEMFELCRIAIAAGVFYALRRSGKLASLCF